MATPSIYVIAAMCGNFWSESGVNPGMYESKYKFGSWEYTFQYVGDLNTGGYGLGQWTNTQGNPHGRLYNLSQWMSANGYAMDSMEGQLKYVSVEAHWAKGTDWQKAIPYDTLADFLASTSTDIDELAKAWLYCWEGIRSDKTLPARQKQAKQVYDYIVANASNIPSTYFARNEWASVQQRLDNSLVVYSILSGGKIPDPGPEPEPEPEPEPGGKLPKILLLGGREVLRRIILHA